MTRDELVGQLMDSPAGMEWWAAPAGTGQWADRLPCAHSDRPDQYAYQVEAHPAPWELLICRRGVVHLRHLPGRPDPGDRVERAALRDALAVVETLAGTGQEQNRDLGARWHVVQQGDGINVVSLTPGVNSLGDLRHGPDDEKEDQADDDR